MSGLENFHAVYANSVAINSKEFIAIEIKVIFPWNLNYDGKFLYKVFDDRDV